MRRNIFYLTCLLVTGLSQAAMSQHSAARISTPCLDCFPETGGGSGSGSGEVAQIPNCSTLSDGQVLYVDQSKPSSGTGLSWGEALKSLSAALEYASYCEKVKEIRVARGTYKPSTEASATGRKHTFFINTALKLIGGYPSGGGDYNPKLNPTILDGDLGGGYRSYHVLVISGTNSPITVEGFRIRNGAADGTGFIEVETNNIGGTNIIYDHSGSAAYVHETANVTFRDCAIYQNGNVNVAKGGGIYCNDASVLMLNSVVAGNTGHTGGGVSADGVPSSIHAVNSTFYGNNGGIGGASYNHLTTTMKFTNCIVWGNSSAWGGNGIRVAEYSVMQEASPGVGNQVADPMFSNPSDLNGSDDQWFTEDDGLALTSCSPAINRGSNAAVSTFSIDKDITRGDRIQHGNVDAGAYEYEAVPQPGGASSLAGMDHAVLKDVNTFVYNGPTVLFHGCYFLATITPSGPNPVSGGLLARVYNPATGAFPEFEGKTLVRRHYHLHPQNNGDVATATITLYFTQKEFDDYNTKVGEAHPQLPKNSTDTEGKSNLIITQLKGNPGDETGRLPQSYTLGHHKFHPNNDDIKWHPGKIINPLEPPVGYWSVTFTANGFSGFFISADTDYPLPVQLLSFEAKPENQGIALSWKTTEESKSSHFLIQRGTGDDNFTDVGKVAASGESTGLRTYRFTDNSPVFSVSKQLYYRLKIVDLDGSFTYSRIAAVSRPSDSRYEPITLLGNPVRNNLRFRFNASEDGSVTLRLTNNSGMTVRKVSRQIAAGVQDLDLDVSMLPGGLYLAELSMGGERQVFRIVK